LAPLFAFRGLPAFDCKAPDAPHSRLLGGSEPRARHTAVDQISAVADGGPLCLPGVRVAARAAMERTVQGSEGERVLAARGGLRVLGSRRRRGELRLVGELDVASREVLTAVAWARDYDVLDASELSFVDCAGLAALLAFASAAQQHGHRLKISSPGRALVRLATL